MLPPLDYGLYDLRVGNPAQRTTLRQTEVFEAYRDPCGNRAGNEPSTDRALAFGNRAPSERCALNARGRSRTGPGRSFAANATATFGQRVGPFDPQLPYQLPCPPPHSTLPHTPRGPEIVDPGDPTARGFTYLQCLDSYASLLRCNCESIRLCFNTE